MKPDNENSMPHDELDRTLDAALAKYISAEPRAGLEDRILVNLRAAETQAEYRAWWMWGFAAALAVMLVIAVVGLRSKKTLNPVIANHPLTAPRMTTAPDAHNREARVAHQKQSAPKSRHASQVQAVAANPKLDVFPSPMPLTAEEVALANYARNFPNEAQLVARTQEEFDLEAQKEMNDTGSETQRSGSIQQER